MNENIINETLLSKNIELLDLYSSEEKKKVNEIFDNFKKCQDSYKTSNSSNIKTKVNNLKSNITNLNTNRKTYSTVLSDVIMRYKETAEYLVASAKKMESDLDAK